jgi:hypothetical protein
VEIGHSETRLHKRKAQISPYPLSQSPNVFVCVDPMHTKHVGRMTTQSRNPDRVRAGAQWKRLRRRENCVSVRRSRVHVAARSAHSDQWFERRRHVAKMKARDIVVPGLL